MIWTDNVRNVFSLDRSIRTNQSLGVLTHHTGVSLPHCYLVTMTWIFVC